MPNVDHAWTAQQMQKLLAFGLSRNEATLYLTSLENGILSVLQLSKLTGINRQQIYDAADRLVNLGLYQPTSRRSRRYVPALPNKLLSLGQARVDEAQQLISSASSLVPELEKLTSRTGSTPVIVKYYEGMDGLKKAYQDELEQSGNAEVLSFAGSLDEIYRFFPEMFWDNWNKKFVAKKSHSRMLAQSSAAAAEAAKHDAAYKRQTRVLEQFALKTNIDVFSDVVLNVSFQDQTAIWLQSRTLADSYRLMFETMWKLAHPLK